MIQVTNDGFGLLRVLGPDISAFIGTTILVIVLACLINRGIGIGARESNLPHADVVKSQRTTRRVAFWIWVIVLAGLLAHAASTVASLRIPRSDVNATGVYIDMNSAIEGRSPR